MTEPNEKPEWDLESARALYDHAQTIFAYEERRFALVEEKAGRFLSVLAFFGAAYGFFLVTAFPDLQPCRSCLDMLLMVSGGIVLILGFITLYLIVEALQLGGFYRLVITPDMFKGDHSDLGKTLARHSESIRTAVKSNSEKAEDKARLLKYAHALMKLMIYSLAVFTVLYFLHLYCKP